MLDQWSLLLRNVGEWRGSFDTYDSGLQLKKRQPSVLTLEPAAAGVPINLRLLFWPDNPLQHQDPFQGEPVRQINQSFYQPDDALTFFPSGSFSRGTLQVAPWSRVITEFCCLFQDRRHRLVLTWDASGRFDNAVQIREIRAGSNAVHQPVLSATDLVGAWHGEEVAVSRPFGASSAEMVRQPCHLQLDAAELQDLHVLSDGGGFRAPVQVSHRESFLVETLWLSGPDRLEVLQREYDSGGGSAVMRQKLLHRVVR